MLEIRHITKVYRSKTGEQVRALNDVSITFPERGMVFILGKSGSGKSTLLNVIGGLDSIDGGEFVIMGKSSKDFAGSDFDSYRNTFIGFIFQEYNILNDFTVGANIGLALELQGKKATDEKINAILTQVEMEKYARRRPNELSGGQKQRIAIARALVKDPQIIMADEPTGALDSGTGKQIFDTLKKLSAEKLVLVVSHDRDFAERYADRIIELADGNVVSDVTKHEVAGTQLSAGIRRVSNHILKIKGGYQLTEQDVAMINDYLAHSREGVLLSGDVRVNTELRSAAGLTEGGANVFEGTNPEKDIPLRPYDGQKTKFIRSRLPIKNAVKMGASGLKHKKFRLFVTILLSLVAFGMFGLSDTMAAYNKITAAVTSIRESGISNASVSFSVRRTERYSNGQDDWVSYQDDNMNDADIAALRERTGIDFVPVYSGGQYGQGVSLTDMMKAYDGSSVAYRAQLSGFSAVDAAALQKMGFALTGRMPEAEGEIVITKFLFDQFNQYGFENETHHESVAAGRLTMDETGAQTILGKHLTIKGGAIHYDDRNTYDFTVVGVVDTRFDAERYEKYLPSDDATQSTGIDLGDIVLQLELQNTLTYGFHTLAFVTEAQIARLAQSARSDGEQELGSYLNAMSLTLGMGKTGKEETSIYYFNRVAKTDVLPRLNVTWLNGTARTTLSEGEYLISRSAYYNLLRTGTEAALDPTALEARGAELFGEVWQTASVRQNVTNYAELIYRAALYRYAAAHFDAASEPLTERGITDVEQYYNILWQEGYDPLGANLQEVAEEAQAQFLPTLVTLYGADAAAPAAALHILTESLGYFEPDATGALLNRETVRYVVLQYAAAAEIYGTALVENETFAAAIREWYGISEEDWNAMDADSKRMQATWFYVSYLQMNEYTTNAYGTVDTLAVAQQASEAYARLTGSTAQTAPVLTEYTWSLGDQTVLRRYDNWTLAGYFETSSGVNESLIVSNTIFADNIATQEQQWGYYSYTEIAPHTSGLWAFAVGAMPTDRAGIQQLVEMSYDDEGDYRFELQNHVMNSLATFNSFIEVFAKVFLWIGVGFAVFSALLLMNFIATSISYKKREIGILRAVGARSSDVFKIFFSEAFLIALINYVFSVIAVLIAVFNINRWMRSYGINVTLLNFGVRQLALMLLISVAVAALASFLPVWRIARKKPIDAIANR